MKLKEHALSSKQNWQRRQSNVSVTNVSVGGGGAEAIFQYVLEQTCRSLRSTRMRTVETWVN